jgi:isopenicillin-N N-acyltransferase-like protein
MIQAFVDQRMRAARVYLFERGIRDEATFRNLGAACLEAVRAWDATGHAEHLAVAAAANVDAVDLFTAGNMTDIRDILALPRVADAEGCSTALVPASHTLGGYVIASQTWDLNPTDLDYVVAVERRPADGPRTWSVTCCGCPSLIGMNEHGVCVGTTNIKTRGSRIGIPYMAVLHRAIRSRTRAEAAAIYESVPLAAAHTYWAADAAGVTDWECTPDSRVRRDGGPLYRTNHCLVPDHAARQGEAATASSQARLARLGAVLNAGRQDVNTIRQLFADRSDGVDSINRFTEDGQGTTTNACFIGIPQTRELHACRGSADRGTWVSFRF